jgi:hypothetical protein
MEIELGTRHRGFAMRQEVDFDRSRVVTSGGFEEFLAALVKLSEAIKGPPGRYRAMAWDNSRLINSSGSFEERLMPHVLRDHDEEDLHTAVHAAREATDKSRLAGVPAEQATVYHIRDDQGRYVGGDSYREDEQARIVTDTCSKEIAGSVARLGFRFEAASRYANQVHAMQQRKGTAIPYVSHPLAVASLVLEHGGGEDEAIAALLHDAAEDQGGRTRLEEIGRLFGGHVAAIVEECSDTFEDPKPPWKSRKQRFLERLKNASPSALLVVAADKLHNARSILKDYREVGEALWSRFRGGREGTLWYYRSLVSAFRAVGSSPLVEELARVVSELEALVGPKPTAVTSPRRGEHGRAQNMPPNLSPIPGRPRYMQRRLNLALKKYHLQHPEEKRRIEQLLEEARREETETAGDRQGGGHSSED